MTRFPKTHYIPQGAVKVADKQSDAVAYIYNSTQNGKPAARVFYGKQWKPVLACWYRTEAEREDAVKLAFDRRRATVAYKAKSREEAKQIANTTKIGDIYRSSWGYDQTNVNYYEVVAKTAKTVTVREIVQETTYDSQYMAGTCIPVPGQYADKGGRDSKAKVCRIGYGGSIKISECQRGYLITPQEIVPGVKVYATDNWSDGH